MTTSSCLVMPTLFIFSGLPGVGKTTMARQLSRHLRASYLRIDTVEQALRDLCDLQVEGEGYRLAYRLAADNLRLGNDVVADSCNPVALTRREWEEVAESTAAQFANIEVVCSDRKEHRRRVEFRGSDIPGHELPTWSQVETREYEPWDVDRIVVDTAGTQTDECFAELLKQLDNLDFNS